jgi:hypothetical protein
MSLSTSIHIDGARVGAAIRQEQGFRFIATDVRAADLDQSVWPTLEAVRQAAAQLVRTGRVDNFSPPSIEE